MATKTKKSTKDKVKSSLKNVLLKEMKDKKEDERLLRVEENMIDTVVPNRNKMF